jgi:hypothetical protein
VVNAEILDAVEEARTARQLHVIAEGRARPLEPGVELLDGPWRAPGRARCADGLALP